MDRLLGTDYATIVTPFTGGTPYGTSAQYSERYEAIQRENIEAARAKPAALPDLDRLLDSEKKDKD